MPSMIEVVADSAQVEAARQAYSRSRAEALALLLSKPAAVRRYESESLAMLRENRESAVAAYSRLRDDTSKPAAERLQAIVALRLLDVPASAEQIAALARHQNEAQFELLMRLDELYSEEDAIPPLIRDVIVQAAADPDRRTYGLAIMEAARRDIREAGPHALARLRASPIEDQRIIRPTGRLVPTREVADLLIAHLKTAKATIGSPESLSALGEVASRTTDPEARKLAIHAVMEYLLAHPDNGWIGSTTWWAIDSLAALPPADARAHLEKLVRSAEWQEVRRYAVRSLAKIDQQRADALSTETGIRPIFEQAAHGATPPPEQFADQCVRHGILTRDEANRALAKLRTPNANAEADQRGLRDDVRGLLWAADRYHGFDTETDTIPTRHDMLIRDFAKHSAGVFRPEAALETYKQTSPDDETGIYRVQFVHAGRLYCFAPRDLRDWYDVGITVNAINRAVADTGATDRFVALTPDGQFANYIFADPSALRAAAQELGLKIAGDPDGSRRQGQAFEDRIRQSLRESE